MGKTLARRLRRVVDLRTGVDHMDMETDARSIPCKDVAVIMHKRSVRDYHRPAWNEDAVAFILDHGVAQGGNWAAMAMSAICYGAPQVFARLDDREYTYVELVDVIADFLAE